MQEDITAKTERALVAVKEGRLDEALNLYRQITSQLPRDAQSWFMLGTVEGRKGLLVEAEAAMRRALEIDASMFVAWLALGQALELQKKFEPALEAYRKASALQPQNAEALEAAGRMCQALQHARDAASYYNDALKAGSPNVALACYLGDYFRAVGNPAEAMQAYKYYLEKFPADNSVRLRYGFVCIDGGMPEIGVEQFAQVLRQEPDNLDARVGEAEALVRLRRKDDAFQLIEPYFSKAPHHLGIALAYARLGYERGYAAEAIARLEALAGIPGSQFYEQSAIGFELGRLYDLEENYDLAFERYRLANDLLFPHVKQEPLEQITNDYIRRYNLDAMRRACRSTCVSVRPVFVIGMPRSGTTLVEQILSRHPEVVAGGELYDIDGIVSDLRLRLYGDPAIVANPLDFSVEMLDEAAHEYLTRTREIAKNAIRVIDKMPENFMYLGPMSLILPKAKVIHCQRDPLDVCLSNYFQRFQYGHGYSYNLETLGRYYRNYERLMRHWHEVTDIQMLDIRYESLVDDLEGTVRKMIEFLGLTWDDACLSFHESKHSITTASFDQASRPIYERSKGRWRHYEKHLEPLRRALAG